MEDDLVRQYAALIKKRERLMRPRPGTNGRQQLAELGAQEVTVIMQWEDLGLNPADLERRAREFNADQEGQEDGDDAE